VLALVAGIGAASFLQSAKKSAYGDVKLVSVYKVAKPIPKGLAGEQALSQNYIQKSEIPQEFRPGTAVTDPNDIKNKVSINELAPGQVLVDKQFVDANVAQVTFAQRVPAGQVAVTISVDQVHGVAGLLMPGDKVNLLVSRPDKADEKNVEMQVMYQNLNILAIGTKAAPQAGDAAASASTKGAATTGDSGLITFSVPLEAAQRIALAAGSTSGGSSVYLTLVPPDNGAAERPAPVNTNTVLANLPLTPYDNV